MCVLSFPANRKRNLYQSIIKTSHPRALATLIDKRIRPGCIAIDISECEKPNPPACVKQETEASRLRHMQISGIPREITTFDFIKTQTDTDRQITTTFDFKTVV